MPPNRGKRVGETYVAQILHDIEKIIRLLVIVAQLLNRFFHHQILGDLRPHDVGLRFLRHKSPSPVSGVLGRFVSRHFADAAGVNVLLGMEFAPSNPVVSLPCHLLRCTPHTVELHPLGAGRHVHNRPVFGRTVVAFADEATLDGSLIVEVGFLGDFQVVSGAVHAARTGTGGAPRRSAAGCTTRVVLDEYVFIKLSAVARAAGGELGQRRKMKRKKTDGGTGSLPPADLDFFKTIVGGRGSRLGRSSRSGRRWGGGGSRCRLEA